MRHVEMSKAAKDRIDVMVVRGDRRRVGKLLYWSSKRGRAKVLLPSGSVITVGIDTVVPLNGGNIVADEIGVDTKYRNFRGVQPLSGGSNERNENMPPVGTSVRGTQPRMGHQKDVTHHVAGIELSAGGAQQDT